MTFWDTFQKPFFALAPLADVTDPAFRRIIASRSAHLRADGTVGGPDVMWTEFVSADGLIRASAEGKEKLMKDLIYDETERPIVAQLFSATPLYMEQASALCRELGFDGIDINMGCPDRSIEKQGAGAAHIKDSGRAIEVILAAKQGAGEVPVSVKLRLGYNTDELETWLPKILQTAPAAVTVHARTRKEMSKVPARWERVRRAVEIRNQCQGDTITKTLIIGNGDVVSLADARAKADISGADGVMLGRAIFGNPWLFDESKKVVSAISLKEKLLTLVEHSKLFEELLPHKSFAIMKKHYKAYVQGFDNATDLRAELMDAPDARAVEMIVAKFLETLN